MSSSKKDVLGITRKNKIMEYMLSVVIPDVRFTEAVAECEAMLGRAFLETIPAPNVMAVLEEYDATDKSHKLFFRGSDGFPYTTYGPDLKGNFAWTKTFSEDISISFDGEGVAFPKKFRAYHYSSGIIRVKADTPLHAACKALAQAQWNKWANLNEKRVKYARLIHSVETFSELVAVWPEIETLRASLWETRADLVPIDPTLVEFIKRDVRG